MGGRGGRDCGRGRGHRGMGMCPGCHGLYSGTGMESGHPVHDFVPGVGSYVDLSSVGSDGEQVGGPVECRHGNPATVTADGDVVDTGGRGSSEQSIQVSDGGLGAEPGVGDQSEHVEQMTLCAGSHQQGPTV